MELPVSRGIPGLCEQIAEQAVGDAVLKLCRGGSWLGLTRELAWRAVTVGGRDPISLEVICASAEARLGSLVDDAIWASEQAALQGFHEYLSVHPGAEADALTAATLDANEEAARRLQAAYAQVLDSLVESAAKSRRSVLRRRNQPPDALAA